MLGRVPWFIAESIFRRQTGLFPSIFIIHNNNIDMETKNETAALVKAQGNELTQLDAVVLGAESAPTEEMVMRQNQWELIEALSISVHDDIPEDIDTLKIKGVATMALEGLHCVKSKAKQGKSSLLTILTSVYIGNNGRWSGIERIGEKPLSVCYVDTEMKPYDTQRMKKQALKLAGITEEEATGIFRAVNMRSILDNNEKKQLIELILEEDNPDVLIIDGVVDLIGNFNEVDESKGLINWLMHTADRFKVALFCVLHTNKNAMDHNMRGHVGTMLEQKSDTVTELFKDAETGLVTVKCTCSRHKPYPDWSFTWDNQGDLIDADEQRADIAKKHAEDVRAERERKSLETKEARKQSMLSVLRSAGGSMQRRILTSRLEQEFSLSRQTVSPLITEWIKDGVVFENDGLIQSTAQTEIFISD